MLKASPSGVMAGLSRTVNVNPGNILAQVTLDVAAIPFPEVQIGDTIVASAAALEAGLVIGQCRCAVAGQITMRLGNVTVGAIDPAAQDFIFTVFSGRVLR